MSGFTALLGAGFVIFGLVMSFSSGHPFIILWTLIALGITIYHAHNFLTGGRGAATEVIDVDDAHRAVSPTAAAPPTVSPADKLRELKRLAELITSLEYERKKDEILRSQW